MNALMIAGCSRTVSPAPEAFHGGIVKLLAWEDSIPAELLSKFERQTGLVVNADYFSDLETVAARVRIDPARYDVVVASDYVVKELAGEGLLASLPPRAADVRSRLDERFRTPWYDPDLRYCIPFMWSLSGLAFNSQFVKAPPKRWADLFDPDRAKNWAGRITLLADSREVMAIALLAGGADPLTSDEGALRAAADRIKAIMPFIVRFDSERFEDALAGGQIWVAHGFNGDLARARARNPSIQYVIPEEGAVLSVDNFVIPVKTGNSAGAMRLIDFLTQPESARAVTQMQGFDTALGDAADALDAGRVLDQGIVLGLPPRDKTWIFHNSGLGEKLRKDLWREASSF